MTDHIIFKYPLDLDKSDNVIPMPEGAIILHVAAVNDQLFVWARLSLDAVQVPRRLTLVCTGEPIPSELEQQGLYIGTAVLLSGRLVLHVFDLGEA